MPTIADFYALRKRAILVLAGDFPLTRGNRLVVDLGKLLTMCVHQIRMDEVNATGASCNDQTLDSLSPDHLLSPLGAKAIGHLTTWVEGLEAEQADAAATKATATG